jgi:hypothetical protein
MPRVRPCILVRCLLLSPILGAAGCVDLPDAASQLRFAGTELPLRPEARDVLKPGSRESFSLLWQGLVPLGTVRHAISLEDSEAGPLLVLDAATEPNRFIAAFAKIGGRAQSRLEPGTLRPRAALWVDADPRDPHLRCTHFDPVGTVFSAKIGRGIFETRRLDLPAVDPLTAFHIGRCLDYEALGGEARLFVVEGAEVHWMILRRTRVDPGEDGRPPTFTLVVETHRLDRELRPVDEEPLSLLEVVVEEVPGLPIRKLQGRLPPGRVLLKRIDEQAAPQSEGAGIQTPWRSHDGS